VSRRTLTLLLAGALAVGLTLLAAVARVPYVALAPGPTYDTLGQVDGTPVLEISGRETFPTSGRLDLTTVGVQPSLTLVQALEGWFDDELAVVPREVVFPPGKTDEEVDAENTAAMEASQSDAVLAAACELGLRVADVRVAEVADDAPARGVLEAGDVLRTVDGAAVCESGDLRRRIAERSPGDPVRIGFLRDGARREATITTGSAELEGRLRPIIGVVTEEEPLDLPFEVDINLEEVGGPSAGLLFALGILDKVTREDLTGGRYIAGTGEISADGTVGPIGGISQKVIAAAEKGAVAFLVPADNCAEAAANAPDGIALVEVATLDDALAGLAAVRAGRAPDTCA
jgi:PDZ domain-containing protein